LKFFFWNKSKSFIPCNKTTEAFYGINTITCGVAKIKHKYWLV
jgi:hypothetical protein